MELKIYDDWRSVIHGIFGAVIALNDRLLVMGSLIFMFYQVADHLLSRSETRRDLAGDFAEMLIPVGCISIIKAAV